MSTLPYTPNRHQTPQEAAELVGILRNLTAQGTSVIFITHNPHHAYMVGDHFVLLNRGRQKLDAKYDDISLEELTKEMAGGDELETLTHELRR